jgi:hypothetical protein
MHFENVLITPCTGISRVVSLLYSHTTHLHFNMVQVYLQKHRYGKDLVRLVRVIRNGPDGNQHVVELTVSNANLCNISCYICQ